MTERLKSSKFKDVNERLTSATTIKINKSGTMFCLDFLLINTKGISVKYKILLVLLSGDIKPFGKDDF